MSYATSIVFVLYRSYGAYDLRCVICYKDSASTEQKYKFFWLPMNLRVGMQ